MARRALLPILILLWTLLGGIRSARAQYNEDYFYWAGRRCLMNREYGEAIRVLNSLLQTDIHAAEGYFLRGVAKFNLDDLLGADADFSTAIGQNPVYTTAYIYRALTRSRLGNYDDALRDFREAIDLRPDLPDAYYSRGYTRLQNKQYAEAIEDFDRFIFQQNRIADAYIGRGTAYLYLQDTVRAMQNFDTAIRTNRENPNGYYQRGTLYLQLQKYREAEEDFDMSIRCDSTFLPPYFNRAIVYANTHRPMQALADFDRAAQLDSTRSIVYFNRAILRSQIGDYNRALEDFDRVALYSPGNVQVYYLRALLKTQLGDLEGAERDYTRAIELYPDFANAYLNRSTLRYALRKPAAARRDEETGKQKIARYKAHLRDSTYSIYADTTQRMDRLLAFDNQFSSRFFDRIAQDGGSEVRFRPLFRFTLAAPDSTAIVRPDRYAPQRLEEFRRRIDNPYLELSARTETLPQETLLRLGAEYEAALRAHPHDGALLLQYAMQQALIGQYTSAIESCTRAIVREPSNPFFYFNRGATRAAMLDFIAGLDTPYQRITIDTDPANTLHNNCTRSYDYSEAIADMTRAIRYAPDFAQAYYNRATLRALSGQLPEAFEDFTRAIELDPLLAEAYYNRGLTQIYMKDTRKGCLDLSKAGELGIGSAYEILRRYTGGQ